MKLKVNRSELQTNDDIWNAVLSAYGEYVFPTEDEEINDFIILFNYFCELESGGHESLFNWFSEQIEEMGIQAYVSRLTGLLEQVGAHKYAEVEKRYMEKLWSLFLAVENNTNEGIEEEFYLLIEKADSEYISLGGELSQLLESYAVETYTEIINIVETR